MNQSEFFTRIETKNRRLAGVDDDEHDLQVAASEGDIKHRLADWPAQITHFIRFNQHVRRHEFLTLRNGVVCFERHRAASSTGVKFHAYWCVVNNNVTEHSTFL